jgi:nucleotide-binding universal stress UspA family protein
MTRAESFKMVVAVDAGDDAAEVLSQAFDQAARHDDPEIHVLRVVEPAVFHRSPDPGVPEAAQFALKELVTETLGTFAQGMGDWRVRLHVRPGRAAEEILGIVGEVEPKLVVLGHGRRRRRDRLGDTVEHVLRTCPAPVLVAMTPDFGDKDEQPAQCPRCVAVREESQGEQWFCAEHQGGYLGTSTLLLPTRSFGLGGGPMW